MTLIERDSKLVRGLRAVQERLKATETVRVEAADALAWMARCAPDRFDLVFIDPPFDADLFVPALKAAVRIVVPSGVIYLEAGRSFVDDPLLVELGLRLHRHGRAGAVHFHLIQRAGPG